MKKISTLIIIAACFAAACNPVEDGGHMDDTAQNTADGAVLDVSFSAAARSVHAISPEYPQCIVKSSIESSPDEFEDLNLWIYHSGKLYTDRFYPCFTGDTKVSLDTNYSYTVYAIANAGTHIAPPVDEDELCDVLIDLDYDPVNGRIPMAGKITVSPHYGKDTHMIPLDRLMSKVGFRVNRDLLVHSSFVVRHVRICHSPSQVAPFAESYSSTAAGVVDGDLASEEDLRTLNMGGEIFFYTGENCFGNLLPDNDDPWQKVPDNLSPEQAEACTYLEILASYEADGISCEDVIERFYLGNNATSNFDVRRNTWSHVILYPTDESISKTSWKIECGYVEYFRVMEFSPSEVTLDGRNVTTVSSQLIYAPECMAFSFNWDVERAADLGLTICALGNTVSISAEEEIAEDETFYIMAVTWDGHDAAVLSVNLTVPENGPNLSDYPFVYYIKEGSPSDCFADETNWLYYTPEEVVLQAGKIYYVYFAAEEFYNSSCGDSEQVLDIMDDDVIDLSDPSCANISFHSISKIDSYVCFRIDAFYPSTGLSFYLMYDGDCIYGDSYDDGNEICLDFDITGSGDGLSPSYEIWNVATSQPLEAGEPAYVGQKLELRILDRRGNPPTSGSVVYPDFPAFEIESETYGDDYYSIILSTTGMLFHGRLYFAVDGAPLSVPLNVEAPTLSCTALLDISGIPSDIYPRYSIKDAEGSYINYDSYDPSLFRRYLAEVEHVSDNFVEIAPNPAASVPTDGSTRCVASIVKLSHSGIKLQDLCSEEASGKLRYRDVSIRAKYAPSVRGTCSVSLNDPFPSAGAVSVCLGTFDGYEYMSEDGQDYSFEMNLNPEYAGRYASTYMDSHPMSSISSTASGITLHCVAAEEDEEEFGVGDTSLGIYIPNANSNEKWQSRTDWYFIRECHYGLMLSYRQHPSFSNRYLVCPQWYHVAKLGLDELYLAFPDLYLICHNGTDGNWRIGLGEDFDTLLYKPEGYDDVDELKRDFGSSAWTLDGWNWGRQSNNPNEGAYHVIYDNMGVVD